MTIIMTIITTNDDDNDKLQRADVSMMQQRAPYGQRGEKSN